MMEFTFEKAPWEQFLEGVDRNSRVSAAQILALSQEEEDMEAVFAALEEKRITLDLSGLPRIPASGELAVRLRQEQQLVARGDLLTGLEETDPLRLYLEELAAIPAAGDIQLLALRYLEGEESAAQMLTNLSLHRVVSLSGEMTGWGVLLLDLIQEASLGLWQAILHYEGGDFESHRDWWIRWYLTRAVVLQARSGGVGDKLRQGAQDYRDVDQRLLTQLGRNPTLEEIAEGMHITAEEAAVYAGLASAASARQRLQQPEVPEEDPEAELAVEDTAYFQSRQRIAELLSCLSDREAELLRLRFGLEGGLPLSPEATGAKLGMTAQEVVDLEAAALEKLRLQS